MGSLLWDLAGDFFGTSNLPGMVCPDGSDREISREGEGIVVAGIDADPLKRYVRIPLFSCIYTGRNPGNCLAYPSEKGFLG
jgi:hypothetical protein